MKTRTTPAKPRLVTAQRAQCQSCGAVKAAEDLQGGRCTDVRFCSRVWKGQCYECGGVGQHERFCGE